MAVSPVRTTIARIVLVALAAGAMGFAAGSPASADSHLSPGCEALTRDSYDSFYIDDPPIFMSSLYNTGSSPPGLGGFWAGETVTMTASEPTQIGTPDTLTLAVGGVVVDQDSFPGTLSYTFPGGITDTSVTWRPNGPSNVLWTVDCQAADGDADGVADAFDLCPGTVLPEAEGAARKNRYAADEFGAFVDVEGTDAGITVADTGGCSGDQIIEAAGLGKGHERFGITRGALKDWIASIS